MPKTIQPPDLRSAAQLAAAEDACPLCGYWRCRCGQTRPEYATADPWRRAVEGLNALVDAGIPVAVALDGVIESPFGDEAIVWDHTAGRWALTGVDDGALAVQRHQLDEIDPVFARLAPGYEVAEGRWTA